MGRKGHGNPGSPDGLPDRRKRLPLLPLPDPATLIIIRECSLGRSLNFKPYKNMNKPDELLASEVEIIYKSKVPASKRVQINHSADAFKVLWEHWDKDTIEHHEEFKILLLNNKNAVLGIADISKGGVNGTIVDPRIVLQTALKAHSSGLILAHNHPSSNPTPSEADVNITKKLAEAGKVMDIQVLDHIILCGDGTYYSLMDECRM
ncbi:MAG TPA: JAB domain-containing protein [Candidatus Cloacimonadota bacterium]|nr:JAB domain-containing protein [Candidatus Cloacimonadota bacterium]